MHAERCQQVEARGLDAQRVRVDRGDQRGAVDRGGDLGRLRHARDRVDPGDHRGRSQWQLGGLAGEALAVGDRQKIGPEPIDLTKQPRLARGGEAEHGDDRGDPDRDPQCGEAGPQPPRAQADARDAREVGCAQLVWGQGGSRAHGCCPGPALTSAKAAGLTRSTLAFTI